MASLGRALPTGPWQSSESGRAGGEREGGGGGMTILAGFVCGFIGQGIANRAMEVK